MIHQILAMFLGLCLALIHLVVGVLSFFIENEYAQGIFFFTAAAGYAAAGFGTIFDRLKLGVVIFIAMFFLNFFIMLYFELVVEFFSCLLGLSAIFIIILRIRADYFSMIKPDEEIVSGSDATGPVITGPKPDPLGFDKNFYYDKYYNKGKKKNKSKKVSKKNKHRPKADEKNDEKNDK